MYLNLYILSSSANFSYVSPNLFLVKYFKKHSQFPFNHSTFAAVMLKLNSKIISQKFTCLKVFFAFLFLTLIIQCKKDSVVSSNLPQNSEVVRKNDSVAKVEIVEPAITYSPFIFPKNKKDSAMAVFNEKFSKDDQKLILALSRLDLKNKWRSDTLVIPDKIDETLMSYSPFPRNVAVLSNVQKIVFFSYPIQAYALYEKGNLVKWGPTSLGKKSAQTKRGLMFANWKKELAISTVDKDWKLPYNFNIHNTLGIGWHQYDLPGFPASHSCLRLLEEDAKFLYNWAEQWTLTDGGSKIKSNGTPVLVFGDYNWGGKNPWFNLSNDPKSNDISEVEMNEIIEPNLSKILEEQKIRDAVKAERELKTKETSTL